MHINSFPILLGFLITCNVNAQLKSLIADSIPLNSNVRHGVLKNGLSYYIFQAENSENTITLQLIEKVGSVHSRKGETGAAHFIEHISFRSTLNFPDGLRKLRRWNTIGGRTTELTTEYTLSISSKDSVLLNYGLLALHDFAKGRLYRVDDVEGERTAVFNESARGDTSINREVYLLLDKNPLYNAALNHVAEVGDCQAMSVETLRRFDRQWYQPARQGIIVVGDVDNFDIEGRIMAMFSDLISEGEENLLPNDLDYQIDRRYDVPLTGRNKMVTIKALGDAVVGIKILQKRKTVMGPAGPSSIIQLKTQLMDDIYHELVMRRLNQLRERADNIFVQLDHFVNRRAIANMAGIDALTTQIAVRSMADASIAVKQVLRELHRIEKHGFTDTELLSAKEAVFTSKSHLLNSFSQSILIALQKHFVYGKIFPDNLHGIETRLLNDISLYDINAVAQEWIREDGNTDVLFSVPNGNVLMPSESEVFSWIRWARDKKVKRFKENLAKPRKLPYPPKVVERDFVQSEIEGIAATQLTLSNGVRVVIKRLGSEGENPWPSLGDIALLGFREGGTNLYEDRDYASAAIAGSIVGTSGVATLNNVEFLKWLTDKGKVGKLEVAPYISDEETGIGGRSDIDNADELFHLVYLYFTKPRRDRGIFDQMIRRDIEKSRVRKSILQIFGDSVQTVATMSATRKSKEVPRFRRTFRIYKERFSNARGFTFVITGYFDTADIIKYIVNYLGCLPAETPVAMDKKAIVRAPSCPTVKLVNGDLRVSMIGDGAGNVDVRMLFTSKYDDTIRTSLLISLNMKILRLVLIERLREREKAVYSARAGGRVRRNSDEFSWDITFDTAPDNVERLTTAVLEELNKIGNGILDNSIFENALTATRSEISKDLISASYVNMYISDQLRKGTMSVDGLKRREILDSLTKHDVIEFFRDSFNKDHYALFQLF